jgi:GNAT superfamily N-acetyltransferase
VITPAHFQVRSPTEADVPAMVKLLAEVFQQDDLMSNYLFPDAEQRRHRQPRMFAAMLRYRHIPEGSGVVAVDDAGRIIGTLIWQHSWFKQSLAQKMKEDMALLAAMGTRVIQGMTLDAASNARAPREPHYRAMYLACDRDWQRSGVGRALLTIMADKSDESGLPMHGACQDDKLPYYLALGSKVIGQTRVGRKGPKINLMFREPNAPRRVSL